MHASIDTQRALDAISARAADVSRAYTPGASPTFDDVTAAAGRSMPVIDPLSVGLPPDSYFLARAADGRTIYTEDGGTRLIDGMLVDAGSRPLLGYVSPEATLTPLCVDPVDAALGRVKNVRVESDGSVAYDRAVLDPRSGLREMQRVVVGRVALARFPAASKPSVLDGTHVAAPPGVVPHVGVPGDRNFSPLESMRRQASHIDFDRSLEKLEDAYLAFDAVQAAHKAKGAIGKTTMDLLK